MNKDAFLRSTEVIDWEHPAVLAQARFLVADETDPAAVARACFEWVRDKVRHSADFRLNPVTCAASQVLRHRTGYCYAKSHLLAALLRASGVPAGLCYQRLRLEDGTFCLHGLNAVLLEGVGWYRVGCAGQQARRGRLLDAPPRRGWPLSRAIPARRISPRSCPTPLPCVVEALRAPPHLGRHAGPSARRAPDPGRIGPAAAGRSPPPFLLGRVFDARAMPCGCIAPLSVTGYSAMLQEIATAERP